MGTHPIFESDFDCLTEIAYIIISGRILRHAGERRNFAKGSARYQDEAD